MVDKHNSLCWIYVNKLKEIYRDCTLAIENKRGTNKIFKSNDHCLRAARGTLAVFIHFSLNVFILLEYSQQKLKVEILMRHSPSEQLNHSVNHFH